MEDAEKTTELKPDWPKGWGRKGAAMYGKRDLVGAYDAYEAGLKLDPNNAGMKNELASVKRAMEQEGGAGKLCCPLVLEDIHIGTDLSERQLIR